jgi:hypothetical protein
MTASTLDSSPSRGTHLPIPFGGRQARTCRRCRTFVRKANDLDQADSSSRFDTDVDLRDIQQHLPSFNSYSCIFITSQRRSAARFDQVTFCSLLLLLIPMSNPGAGCVRLDLPYPPLAHSSGDSENGVPRAMILQSYP